MTTFPHFKKFSLYKSANTITSTNTNPMTKEEICHLLVEAQNDLLRMKGNAEIQKNAEDIIGNNTETK